MQFAPCSFVYNKIHGVWALIIYWFLYQLRKYRNESEWERTIRHHYDERHNIWHKPIHMQCHNIWADLYVNQFRFSKNRDLSLHLYIFCSFSFESNKSTVFWNNCGWARINRYRISRMKGHLNNKQLFQIEIIVFRLKNDSGVL